MRKVAGLILALVIVAAMPTTPAADNRLNTNDECWNDITPGPSGGNSCLRVDWPTGTPDAIKTNAGSRYFLWLGALDCSTGPACATLERPIANNPAGMQGVHGLLWADMNGFDGLQREAKKIGAVNYAADTILIA